MKFDYLTSAPLNKEEVSDATTLLIQSYNLLTVYYNTMLKALISADKLGTEVQKEERAIDLLENLENVGSVNKTLTELQSITKKVISMSLDGYIGEM